MCIAVTIFWGVVSPILRLNCSETIGHREKIEVGNETLNLGPVKVDVFGPSLSFYLNLGLKEIFLFFLLQLEHL